MDKDMVEKETPDKMDQDVDLEKTQDTMNKDLEQGEIRDESDKEVDQEKTPDEMEKNVNQEKIQDKIDKHVDQEKTRDEVEEDANQETIQDKIGKDVDQEKTRDEVKEDVNEEKLQDKIDQDVVQEKIRDKTDKDVDQDKMDKAVDQDKTRDRKNRSEMNKSKRKRGKSRDRDRSRSRDRGRGRSRSRDRDRDRNRDRDRDRSRNRDRGRNMSPSRDRDRSRSRNRDRNMSRDQGKERDTRDKSRDRMRHNDERGESQEQGGVRYWDRLGDDVNRYRDQEKNRYSERSSDRSRNRDRDRDRDNGRYKDRERDSEERHGEVSQNSYYGTDLKFKSRDSERNGDQGSKQDGTKQEEENRKRKSANDPEIIPPRQKKTVDLLTSKTGGAYIPPAKLRMMQAEISDKSGAAYQRIAWEALKKSIHGFINKVNTSNIGPITRDLLKENIVRGRGLLVRSIIQAQAASPTFTPVYAALVSVINSKFPNIGELLLKRLAIQFKRGLRRNDKPLCISSATFIAHLVNQGVAHEILVLEILTLLVQAPTNDSIEVAIALLKESGMKLTQVSRKGIEAIFEMLRNILHEGQLDKRVQYMIEVMFQIRKDGFKDHESVPKDLDLVEEEDQLTHLVTLDEATDGQDILNVFKFDSEYTTNEEKYKELSKEILNSEDSDSDGEEGSGSEEDEESNENEEDEKTEGDVIVDNTETNLTALRRTIYLTIHSSLDFEECAHKLMKMQLKPGQEIELCHMFLDCCAEMRTYEKFFGLLAGRFCAINKTFVEPFEQIFKDSYDTIHRLDTNRLRNVGKFFAHLLMTDSISWAVLANVKLNEEDTTSSSRVFIKILFQELSEYMGLPKLNDKLKDPYVMTSYVVIEW